MRTHALVVLIILFWGSIAANSQQPTLLEQDDIQSWNDIQLTVSMSKKVDFVTQLTGRFGGNISRLNDSRFQFGFAFKPNKSWTFQPFYWHIRARNTRGQFRTENRLNFRIGYKFPTKSFGLSHRSWFEYRLKDTGNSWRYRPSLTFEKDLPKDLNGKFYVTDEVFYDSLLKKFSRNRLTVGINKVLTKQLSIDLYFMRQNDGFSRPGDLNVIGTSWKVKL